MRIALIHPNDGSDVRVGKTCRSMSRLGYDIHFIGWDRRPDSDREVDLGGATAHILSARTRYGRSSVEGQFRFLRHIVHVLARLRPDIVHCVNEDYGLLLLPFRGVLYRRLVCDVFDALPDRHSSRSASARVALRVASEVVRAGCDRLIATDEARYRRFGRHRRKSVIVENVPEDPGDEPASRLPTGPPSIYVAGTLHVGRGLAQILRAAEIVGDLRIVSAGWLYDDFANDVFAVHECVTYHGIVTAARSLELAAACDAVFAYYAPTTTNNLFASPNKVYDAMSVGRPVIINSEPHVARWVLDNAVGWTCPYDDVEQLAAFVARLADARSTLPDTARRLRQQFLRGLSWEHMERRLSIMYDELA